MATTDTKADKIRDRNATRIKNEQGAHSPVGYKEGQARLRASDHKHQVTIKETVEGGVKKVECEDHRNTKGKVFHARAGHTTSDIFERPKSIL